jgi:CheY-like chemotaxis protein
LLDSLFRNMAARTTPVRILVVDDDAMSRDLLAVLLEAEGYAVDCAESGDAALALLSRGGPIPQIVLADVQMPGITGRKLADALRELCGRATLLLAMSGSGPANDAVARFDGFLRKPFTMQQFAATISAKPVAARKRPSASKKPMAVHTHESSPAGISIQASADASPNETPALDEHIFKQLSDAMPGPQLRQMYGMCIKDARSRIDAMRGFAAQHDAAQFVREAHAVKGGCGMLGASELYGMAARLEKSGLDSPGLNGIPGVNPLDELIAACDRLERILGARA